VSLCEANIPRITLEYDPFKIEQTFLLLDAQMQQKYKHAYIVQF